MHPKSSLAPLPNHDMEEGILKDYNEAALIVGDSPRGAAALLRLCIQKLCKQLGEEGKSINDDIASLVKKGLSPKVQKALDIVRVIGNESVHPGTIDISDDKEMALKLFNLVNIIADEMITRPKEIDELYNSLPEGKREQIEKRDGKNK